MKIAQNLCGAELNKVLSETLQFSLMNKSSTLLSQHGDFEEVSDVEEKYKNRPTILANILKNGTRKKTPGVGGRYDLGP